MLTIAIATVGALLIAAALPPEWRLGWQTALVLSGALAMSSTAIVVKLMAERLELDSEHGKRVMGVLLFQDLAVVPLLVLIPALGAPPETLLKALGFALRQGGLPDRRAALWRTARDALVAHAGRAPTQRRTVHAQPAAGHAGPGVAHRSWRACRWRSAPSSPAC